MGKNNNMKISRAKEYLHLVRGLAEGKAIQVKSYNDDWVDWSAGDEITFDSPPEEYRIKPTAKLRAWKPEEVPFGAIVRIKGHNISDPCGQMITWKDSQGKVCLGNGQGGVAWYSPKELFDDGWLHSLDGGKTWKPCGVEAE